MFGRLPLNIEPYRTMGFGRRSYIQHYSEYGYESQELIAIKKGLPRARLTVAYKLSEINTRLKLTQASYLDDKQSEGSGDVRVFLASGHVDLALITRK